MWPHRGQPTRLCCPWDSPGKNIGVGCHFLLQCMKVKSESEVAQSCLCDPMDCSLPGSSIHGIFQARVLEWVVVPILLFASISLHWSVRKAFLFSMLFFGTLNSVGYIFPFLLCFLLLFFSQLFLRPPQIAILLICISFSWGSMPFLINASCTMSWTSVHSSSGTLSIRANPLNLFLTSTV